MKAYWHHILLIVSILFISSCLREEQETDFGHLPEGTPITMMLDFGAEHLNDVWLGTKADANRADESSVRDLYVLIFDDHGDCFYSRYFAYQHMVSSRATLVSQPNEGWYVDNLTLQEVASGSSKKTRGVVKISTEARNGCTVILLANIKNTLVSLDGSSSPEKYLETIRTLSDFNNIEVHLSQDLTLRDDLFLMMGKMTGVSTGDMAWDKNKGASTGDYGEDYKVVLRPLDAKVKFRIRANSTNIQSINPRLWRVYRVPRKSYLSDNDYKSTDPAPDDEASYFDTSDFYFEGTERDDAGTWEVFSFYMLQNRQEMKNTVDHDDSMLPEYCDITTALPNYQYYRREFQVKTGTADNHQNGAWYYAKPNATYVQFDLILTLTEAGINAIDNHIAEALTTDAVFTVHLGDFNGSASSDYDDYKTLRGYSYTYNIVVNNSKSIYVEVLGDGDGTNKKEKEPGQEGSLLLTTDGIINCDAHYEYHTMVFKYNEDLGDTSKNTLGGFQNRKSLSWHIKSPFHENGIGPDKEDLDENGWYKMPEPCDCEWVMFMINQMDGDYYKTTRCAYPGPGTEADDPTYVPEWTPSSGPVPTLMDINQLVNFLFWQNEEKCKGSTTTYFDKNNEIRLTAFVNEFYYEVDPLTGKLDTELWRKFVNTKPRELHILSDAERSKDGRSDVITSSHSIIQQSIQTIYNVYSPSLSNIWGTEHNDKIHKGAEDIGWPWWPDGAPLPAGSILYGDENNGRINTAGIWGLTSGLSPEWGDYLNYEVDNDMPELRSEYQYLAYACMSRNRDNNGNRKIDMDELRWYTGAINQLVGMWVGNEALTQTARLYQPKDATSQTGLQWRSETVSSTAPSIDAPRVIRAEEGCTKSGYKDYTFWTSNPVEHQKISSVRCLRNVGTYRDMGVPKDISYAPADMMVDEYYECAQGVDPNGNAWPNDDGTYTITFSHLNNKSIREYTDKDLPYHEEYALHNCVYLSFTAMNPADDICPDGINKSLEVLNDEISVNNYVCPEGYRLPNMTELLLMSALLPDSYWVEGQNYPSRTYFSLGYLAAENKQKTTENNKIGWSYYTQKGKRRVHLKDKGNMLYKFRCVQDDHTKRGDITGDIVVENWDHLQRGDELKIQLDFNSVGAAINYVKLELHYTDAAGNQRKKNIPYTLGNASLIIEDEEPVSYGTTILEELPSDVHGQMSVHAILRNTHGVEREFETPIRLESELKLSIRLLPLQYDAGNTDPPLPILVTAYNVDDKHIISWKLRITTPSGSEVRSLDLPDYGGTDVTYASRIFQYEYAGTGGLQEGTYTFQLEATDNYDAVTRSDVVSMDVLKVYYSPYTSDEITRINNSRAYYDSPKPGYYTNETYIKRWKRQMIQGLDFPSGDFIETNIDISKCIHVPYVDEGKDPSYTQDDVGFDKIVTIGLNSTDWATNQFNVFYPSCPTSASDSPTWLYLQPTWSVGTSVGYRGIDYSLVDSEKPLHLRLDKNGVHWNGNLVDISQWPSGDLANIRGTFEKLMNAHTLFIGSTEGNPSRATYRFVRVVYNGRDSSIRGGNDVFDQNPVNGGKL